VHFRLKTGKPLAAVDAQGLVHELIEAVGVLGGTMAEFWEAQDGRPYKLQEVVWSYELTKSRFSKLGEFRSKRAEAVYSEVPSGRIHQLSFELSAWGPGKEYGSTLVQLMAGFPLVGGVVSLILPGYFEPVDPGDPGGRHQWRFGTEAFLATPPGLLAAVVDLALAVGRFGAPLSGSAGFGPDGLRGWVGAYMHSVVPFGVDSYDWMVALPPEAVERLGGVDRVVAEAPVAFADVIESPDGTSVLCRVTEDPLLVTVEQRRAWRGYLVPVLPEKAPLGSSSGEVIHLVNGGFVLPEDIDWPGRDPAVFTVPWERSDG
jgi:hypothetical protein